MKKLTLIFIILILSLKLFSQNEDFKGGLIGGIVMSQVDGDRFSGYNKFGFQAGAYVNTKIAKSFALQMEIKFIQKGSKQISQKYAIYYKMSLNYVEIPFLLIYQYNKDISAETGLSYAYLFTAKEDTDGYGAETPSSAFNKSDMSFIFGINYQITEKIKANAKFSYSLIPIRNYPGNQVYYFDRGQYNNLLTVSLYYNLGD